MGKEIAKEIFKQQLASLRVPREVSENDELWDLSRKFEKQIEKSLVEAEQRFLEREPIVSVIGVIEEASKFIEERERIEPGSIYKTAVFEIDILGLHGPGCYPEYEREGRFVKAIEGGKDIDTLINGFRIFLNEKDTKPHYHMKIRTDKRLGFTVAMSKNMMTSKFSEICWEIGPDDGILDLQKSDIGSFAKLVAERVVAGRYEPRSSGTDMGDGWSIN